MTQPPAPDLEGVRALVTGGTSAEPARNQRGTSGLGFAMSQALTQAGARVVLTGRTEQRVQEAAAEHGPPGWGQTRQSGHVTQLEVVAMSRPAQQTGTARSAIVAPGGNYGPDGPLLMYASLAVRRRGGDVHPIAWELAEGSDFTGQRRQVISQVESAVRELMAATGTAPLIIGKSLGSLAAPVAADHGLAAVWFTPLLTDEPTVAALRRATAPCLLAGGSADQAWDGQLARTLSREVAEIDGADHGMFVPGPLAASAAALGQVITAVEDFLDHVVWP